MSVRFLQMKFPRINAVKIWVSSRKWKEDNESMCDVMRWINAWKMKTISDLNMDEKYLANDMVKFIRYFHPVCLIGSDPGVENNTQIILKHVLLALWDACVVAKMIKVIYIYIASTLRKGLQNFINRMLRSVQAKWGVFVSKIFYCNATLQHYFVFWTEYCDHIKKKIMEKWLDHKN